MSRLRLDPEAYDRLRQAVLERDSWRCQQCGQRTNLEVHHLQHRSQQGEDVEHNLITVCADCHRQSHLQNKEQCAAVGPVNFGFNLRVSQPVRNFRRRSQ